MPVVDYCSSPFSERLAKRIRQFPECYDLVTCRFPCAEAGAMADIPPGTYFEDEN